MRESRGGGRAVPMLLPGRDEDEVSLVHLGLSSLRGDDARAVGHDEHLVMRVAVELVPRARSKDDVRQVVRRAVRRRYVRLPGHLPDEDRPFGGLRLNLARMNHSHEYRSRNLRSKRAEEMWSLGWQNVQPSFLPLKRCIDEIRSLGATEQMIERPASG